MISTELRYSLKNYLPFILNRMIVNWHSECSKNKYCPGVYISNQMYAGLST